MTGLMTPPTDNLYKFIAIAGLVLVVTAIITAAKQYDRLDQQFANRLALVQADAARTDAEFDVRVAKAKNPQADTSSMERAAESAKQELQSLQQAGLTKEKLDLQDREALRWFWGMICVGVFGFLVMTLGFSWWYLRLQRLQDAILRADVARIRTT